MIGVYRKQRKCKLRVLMLHLEFLLPVFPAIVDGFSFVSIPVPFAVTVPSSKFNLNPVLPWLFGFGLSQPPNKSDLATFPRVSETTLLGHAYPRALRLLGFVGRCIFVAQSLPQHQPKSRWIIMFLHSYFWSRLRWKIALKVGVRLDKLKRCCPTSAVLWSVQRGKFNWSFSWRCILVLFILSPILSLTLFLKRRAFKVFYCCS